MQSVSTMYVHSPVSHTCCFGDSIRQAAATRSDTLGEMTLAPAFAIEDLIFH